MPFGSHSMSNINDDDDDDDDDSKSFLSINHASGTEPTSSSHLTFLLLKSACNFEGPPSKGCATAGCLLG